MANDVGNSGACGIGGLLTSDRLESSVWSGEKASSLDLLSSLAGSVSDLSVVLSNDNEPSAIQKHKHDYTLCLFIQIPNLPKQR